MSSGRQNGAQQCWASTLTFNISEGGCAAPRASPSDGPTFADILTILTQPLIPWFERGARAQNPQQAENDDANSILVSFQWHEDTIKTNGRIRSCQLKNTKRRLQSTSHMRGED